MGDMGNLEIVGTIFNQAFDFKVDLSLQKPFDAIKSLADKIVDAIKNAIEQINSVKTSYNHFALSDDMIKLTLARALSRRTLF